MFANKWMITGIVLFILVMIPFSYLWILVSRYDDTEPDRVPRQAAIVLGAALWDQQPSPALQERLNQALSLYKDGLVQYIVLSGGLGDNGITEAEGMKKYLMDRGVPAGHLILEDRSSNTKENLKFTAEVLQKHKWTKLYLVTHDYHMYRALNYARQAGIQASAAPVHSQVLFMPYHKTRECLALIKQKVFHQ
ncbi:YdcF family protein [Paenactinomyces guangxiensis]|uniref:YdcF family protein n=1 Tax=Paenactinomyces guangxiensis TaxID=1490290 RepID=A0A7W1WRS9_9BACL|nr:YdcF family protein [Paenactinomyces guangxiensis]MBA4494871.1 YdcF family protein [Paenactinomyces guangxiensis]MBH8591954.1 YdcF family protein [Paenactinomyces guangxiensis]